MTAPGDLTRLRRLADLADAGDWLREERDDEIRRLRGFGFTVGQIVDATGLTRARVYQILENTEPEGE